MLKINSLVQEIGLSTPTYSGYAVGYGLETVLGPIELKYSWSPRITQRIHLD
jgi:hypothetical protein